MQMLVSLQMAKMIKEETQTHRGRTGSAISENEDATGLRQN
jgi:hypothetical protein